MCLWFKGMHINYEHQSAIFFLSFNLTTINTTMFGNGNTVDIACRNHVLLYKNWSIIGWRLAFLYIKPIYYVLKSNVKPNTCMYNWSQIRTEIFQSFQRYEKDMFSYVQIQGNGNRVTETWWSCKLNALKLFPRNESLNNTGTSGINNLLP